MGYRRQGTGVEHDAAVHLSGSTFACLLSPTAAYLLFQKSFAATRGAALQPGGKAG